MAVISRNNFFGGKSYVANSFIHYILRIIWKFLFQINRLPVILDTENRASEGHFLRRP